MLGTAHLRQELLGRVRADAPHRDHFAKAIGDAFDVVHKLDEEVERIDRDGRFTAKGRSDFLADLVVGTLAPKLAKEAGRVARHAGQRNESVAAAIGRPEVDKADLVSELGRQEVRTMVRTQPPEKRMQVALEVALDKGMAEALLYGPGRVLTGLSEPEFQQLHRIHLQHHHKDALDEVEKMRQDIAAVGAAVQVAWDRLKAASGMSVTEFSTFWKSLETLADRS